jgi:hypothetical protein
MIRIAVELSNLLVIYEYFILLGVPERGSKGIDALLVHGDGGFIPHYDCHKNDGTSTIAAQLLPGARSSPRLFLHFGARLTPGCPSHGFCFSALVAGPASRSLQISLDGYLWRTTNGPLPLDRLPPILYVSS